MPDTPAPMSVPDAIYHTVHGYPGGVAALAAALGYTVTRATPDQSGGRPVQALVRLQVEVADLLRAVADPLDRLDAQPADYITGTELRRVEYHAQELSAALAHLVASLRARMRPAPKVEY